MIKMIKMRVSGAKNYFNEQQLLKHQSSLMVFKVARYFSPLKFPDLDMWNFAADVKILPY